MLDRNYQFSSITCAVDDVALFIEGFHAYKKDDFCLLRHDGKCAIKCSNQYQALIAAFSFRSLIVYFCETHILYI